MPEIENFSLPAGDSAVLNFTINPEEPTGSSIANSDIKWWVAKSQYSLEVEIMKEIGNGIIIIDEDDRIFEVQLDQEDTEFLRGDYYHEAQIITPGGIVSTVTIGTMTIIPTIIRGS